MWVFHQSFSGLAEEVFLHQYHSVFIAIIDSLSLAAFSAGLFTGSNDGLLLNQFKYRELNKSL